jgi:hypothetical protein
VCYIVHVLLPEGLVLNLLNSGFVLVVVFRQKILLKELKTLPIITDFETSSKLKMKSR